MGLPIGYLIPIGQPRNHIDKATLNRFSRFYLYINACIRTVTIREKRDHQFESGTGKRFEEATRRGKLSNYISIKNIFKFL